MSNCETCTTNGCQQCEDGYFMTSPSHPCLNCGVIPGCKRCDNGWGCMECEEGLELQFCPICDDCGFAEMQVCGSCDNWKNYFDSVCRTICTSHQNHIISNKCMYSRLSRFLSITKLKDFFS